jgi:hypothetical protein
MKIVNIQEIIKTEDLFHCGSPNLNRFLQNNELDYVSSYIASKNKKTIWLYLKCDRLSELLTIWSNNGNKNKSLKGGEVK